MPFDVRAATLPGVSAPSSVESEELRLALDRALGERRGPLLDGDGVNRADSRQARLERELEARRERRRLGHETSVALA